MKTESQSLIKSIKDFNDTYGIDLTDLAMFDKQDTLHHLDELGDAARSLHDDIEEEATD